MKRCLFLAPRYAPFPGGAETYAHDLCTHLYEFGWDCVVLTDAVKPEATNSPIDKRPTVVGLEGPINQLLDKSRVRWRTLQFGLLEEIWAVVSDLPKIDVVHANSIETLIIGRMIADHLDVPFIATIHEHAPEKQAFGLGRLRLAFERLAPDMLIAPSNFYYDRALAAGTPAEKVAKISHGISLKRIQSGTRRDWRAEWGGSSETKYVVLIGRIYQPKGVLEFVKAVHQLRDVPGLKAIVVGPDGPGEYSAEVRRQVRLLGLQDIVSFIGEVLPTEIPSIIQSADLIVAPSLAEGFGLAVVESMLLGVPVIASRVGGLAEVIDDGITGELVEPGNISQLAEAMEKLLECVDLRQSYSSAAAATARERFSATRMAEETADLYQKLTANRAI